MSDRYADLTPKGRRVGDDLPKPEEIKPVDVSKTVTGQTNYLGPIDNGIQEQLRQRIGALLLVLQDIKTKLLEIVSDIDKLT